jgi:hypothetical protein
MEGISGDYRNKMEQEKTIWKITIEGKTDRKKNMTRKGDDSIYPQLYKSSSRRVRYMNSNIRGKEQIQYGEYRTAKGHKKDTFGSPPPPPPPRLSEVSPYTVRLYSFFSLYVTVTVHFLRSTLCSTVFVYKGSG